MDAASPQAPQSDHAIEVGVAGASARATYERRENRRRQQLHDRRSRTLAIGGTGILLGAIWWASGATIGSLSPIWGLVVALLGISWIVGTFARPQHIQAWRTGARGEERTAAALRDLPAGWIVLHDRRIPRTRGNIDHIAIGPPGVFVIDSKDYAGRLTVADGQLRVRGRNVNKWIEGLDWQRIVVDGILAEAAIPARSTRVLCVHRARIRLLSPIDEGVEILSGGDLRSWLVKQPIMLDQSTVQRIADRLALELPPAARSAG